MARVSQGQRLDAMKDSIDGLKTSIDTIHVALVGDITTDKPGLITRVDRLEQHRERDARQWIWVRGALISIALAMLPLAINSCQNRNRTEAEHTEIVQELLATQPEPSPVPIPTEYPTPTITPTPTPTPAIIELGQKDIHALSALCWVETRGMENAKRRACFSVLSTVFTRANRHILSDGTILGTITWDCTPEKTECQFPAFVVNGCEGITHPCPFDDAPGMVEFMGYVYEYLYGYDTIDYCKGFLFYHVENLSGGSKDTCVIATTKDGGVQQVMNFWNRDS